MQPVIAKKTTTCHYCKETIIPGSERLSDTTYIRYEAEGVTKYRYNRRHFHFRITPESTTSCYDDYAQEVFKKLPTERVSNNPRGRPAMDISPIDMKRRRSLLRRLYNQLEYYIGKERITTGPVLLTEVSRIDVKRAEKFRDNLAYILLELGKVGGVPDKFKHYTKSSDKETKVA